MKRGRFEVVLAGYTKAGLWVSSTGTDMDVHVSLLPIDQEDREIRYEAVVLPMNPHHSFPVGFGSLKVSHCALDKARTAEHWPAHTHNKSDKAHLVGGEVDDLTISAEA